MKNLTLRYSVKADGETITELTMRIPRVKDMLAADAGGTDAERELRLFANLCDVAPSAIEEMAMVDYLSLQEVYGSFLSSAPATAGRPA